MKEIDLISCVHKKTSRNYIDRVINKEYPKHIAAKLAKLYAYDYWDGDRNICYGGYKYIKGYWKPVVDSLIKTYELPETPKILDIGCGKGYLLHDLKKAIPKAEVYGIDISEYAVKHAKPEVKDNIVIGNANKLPYENDSFDLVISITTLHNLHAYDLDLALREIERVGKNNKYICVESYRSEEEKANLLYWQVTCEAFNTPDEWMWWFKQSGYTGDYSFIFFE